MLRMRDTANDEFRKGIVRRVQTVATFELSNRSALQFASCNKIIRWFESLRPSQGGSVSGPSAVETLN